MVTASISLPSCVAFQLKSFAIWTQKSCLVKYSKEKQNSLLAVVDLLHCVVDTTALLYQQAPTSCASPPHSTLSSAFSWWWCPSVSPAVLSFLLHQICTLGANLAHKWILKHCLHPRSLNRQLRYYCWVAPIRSPKILENEKWCTRLSCLYIAQFLLQLQWRELILFQIIGVTGHFGVSGIVEIWYRMNWTEQNYYKQV